MFVVVIALTIVTLSSVLFIRNNERRESEQLLLLLCETGERNLDGEGFEEHEVTDITLYDTQDTSRLVWFTVPKYTGEPIWLPPYITDNLDVRVISYNVPIYWKGRFVGVVGIEIDYTTMSEQVESLRLYSSGYAFLSDADGKIFFHPHIDVAQLTEATMPDVPDGLLSDSTFVRYRFEGVEKQAAWLPLSNGMRLNVAVPVSETEGDWQRLADHMKEHINDLSKRVYVDALTSVKNKGAFTSAIEALQGQMDADREQMAFAIGVFDCDDLKLVNDRYGHDKGDIYLKTACRLICTVFQHSPVFRIGGDEFAVILRNDDYDNRAELVRLFEQRSGEINAANAERWKQVRIAMGIAVYDDHVDHSVVDVVHRADKIMYTNKHLRKEAQKR